MTDEIPGPRENADLHGHEEAEHFLENAFRGGRMAHAWLISGPRGIGKATLAYRFTRYVLSGGASDMAEAGPDLFGGGNEIEQQGGLYVPPEHPVFHRIAAGTHADMLGVERTVNEKTGKLRTEIVVDDVRDVSNFFHHTAGEGGWRVVVVDCADEMNANAANALLKVLEEPPVKALLLLVSHNPGRLPATIRSRCCKLALKPLAENAVASLLRTYLPDLEAADVSALAHLADGSPGRALALATEGGLELYRDMTGLLETLPKLDVQALHAFGTRFGKSGAEDAFQTASDLLRWWLGRLILATAGGGREKAPFTPDEEALMDRLGRAAGLDRWFEVWEKINRLLAKASHANLDRKQVVLNVFLTLENAVRS